MTPQERIEDAERRLARGATDNAIASALIAIAQLLQVNIAETYGAGVLAGTELGATATADALSAVMGVTRP